MLDLLIATVVISFLSTYMFAPYFIRFLRRAGIVGRDMNKIDKPEVPEMGAPIVVVGFLAGIFFYTWINIFVYKNTQHLIEVLAAISTVLIITIIGMFDDLSVLFKSRSKGKLKNHKRVGIRQWQKALMTLPAAIPLMAIMAGNSTMIFPIIGQVNVGILYPFLIVPAAVAGASNGVNLLGGMNGLEASLGSVVLTALGIFAYINGRIDAAFLAFAFAAALFAFLRYNWFPAKIFPGDSLSYAIGAAIATVAIIGNIEKFALYIFGIFFLELLLKLRSRLKAENFGKIKPDGTLEAPYEKSYSMTHVAMKLGKFKEWQITLVLVGFELFFIAVAFSLLLNVWEFFL